MDSEPDTFNELATSLSLLVYLDANVTIWLGYRMTVWLNVLGMSTSLGTVVMGTTPVSPVVVAGTGDGAGSPSAASLGGRLTTRSVVPGEDHLGVFSRSDSHHCIVNAYLLGIRRYELKVSAS